MPHSANSTASFLGAQPDWPGAAIALENVTEGVGGFRIYMRATGFGVVQVVDADGQERRYPLRLSSREARALLLEFVEQDLLTIPRPTGTVADAGPELQIWLNNRGGRYEFASGRPGTGVPRFDALHSALMTLAQRAQARREPSFAGKFDRHYKPSDWMVAPWWQLRSWIYELRYWHPRDLVRSIGEFLFILIQMWPVVLGTVAQFIIAALFIRIDPKYVYNGGWGVVHGWFAMANFIMSPFTGRPAVAPLNTGISYNAGFWLGLFVLPGVYAFCFGIVRDVLRRR